MAEFILYITRLTAENDFAVTLFLYYRINNTYFGIKKKKKKKKYIFYREFWDEKKRDVYTVVYIFFGFTFIRYIFAGIQAYLIEIIIIIIFQSWYLSLYYIIEFLKSRKENIIRISCIVRERTCNQIGHTKECKNLFYPVLFCSVFLYSNKLRFISSSHSLSFSLSLCVCVYSNFK